MDKLLSKLPTVPDYFKNYVDKDIDLNNVKSIPCPFHEEKHGKSFSYTPLLGKWRCWGACHCGGDVIDLHRLNYHLKTREEAKESLCAILGIKLTIDDFSFSREVPEVDEESIYRNRVYSLAVSLAKCPDDWDKLDYILSKAPFDVRELEVFCAELGYPISK